MIPQGSPVVQEGNNIPTTGRGGKEIKQPGRLNATRRELNNKEQEEEEINKLRSRFGEAFLPYARQLESVDEERTYKKRMGRRKKIQSQKVNNRIEYKNDEERINQYQQNRQKNTKNINERMKKTMTNDNANNRQLNWYVDQMTFDEGWPNIDKRDTIRIFHINLNGISHYNDYLKWEMTIGFLMDMQVDIFGLTEINLDMNNGRVRDNFIQYGKHFDQYINMTTSSSKQTVGSSPFKMGGTVTGTNGCWLGRIQQQGSDKLGRWSYMSLQARYGNLITFITVYLPCKPSGNGGGTTIYRQMEADLLFERGELKEPRKELLQDLHAFIDKERQKGNTIFLMGDMNDNLGMETGQV